ncbi:DUF4129 domain-containing protein [Naasia aerilata]|uniref:Protein-glutamine gamma-glutamyltransferase-like C-terminal domain-containing protein n=1 Tax=Naasia aerilata TaxID=1162966 RepID=A0ABM8GCL3_9MICO|nr:DUF4129 domain-containing protein [Naasia aerilata]BDZ45996.1 hypothetical protein GCM10025866_19050 [Naasia aerilata]
MSALLSLARSVPVEPDGDQGRGWLIDELGKPVYQAARPTWFDLVSQAFFDWLGDLLNGAGSGAGAVALVVVVLLIAALLVGAFLVFGRPRLNRRSAALDAVFGEDDARGAEELRASAERAAAGGDFTTAIQELFRALARGFAERTILDLYPGMTARGFAREAGAAFPDRAAALGTAASDFDAVRYLGRPGTADQYAELAALERSLRSARTQSPVAS